MKVEDISWDLQDEVWKQVELEMDKWDPRQYQNHSVWNRGRQDETLIRVERRFIMGKCHMSTIDENV
ncbi:hypothetical protein J6590_008681 [Homalodisca vitripennis]|nr:hypothetical protein J6590_008681 [Homalodisca vitripennis]